MSAPSSSKPPAALRVLLAEDNLINQRLVAMLLRFMGHQIDVVDDGQQALNALEIKPYDVVLMDVMMPNLDGVSALRRILADARAGKKRPPVIMVTAHAAASDREQLLKAGASGYVPKPVAAEVLKAEIERVIASQA